MKIKQSKSLKRNVAISIVLFCLVVGGVGAWWLLKSPGKTAENQQQPVKNIQEPVKVEIPSLRFSAMGDMLAHDSVVNNAKTEGSYDFKQYFTRVQNMYKDSDVVFCNPETPAAGAAFGVSGYPTFNAPTEFARDLNSTGCNLINLATNHIYDKGQIALDATLSTWENLQILAVSGANRNADEQQNSVKYFTKNDIKVAFVAFADFSNNRSIPGSSFNTYHNRELVTSLLSEARKNADLVIVSAHWGTEDSNVVNQDQIAATDLFASLGVDVIIGTGPHVLQKVSYVSRPDGNKTLVWYSIGNMLSSQLNANQLTGGVAGFTVEKVDGKINIKDLTFQSTFMSYDWTTADRAAGRLAVRHNLMLYPLAEAGDHVTKFGANLAERIQYVHDTIGQEAPVTITP